MPREQGQHHRHRLSHLVIPGRRGGGTGAEQGGHLAAWGLGEAAVREFSPGGKSSRGVCGWGRRFSEGCWTGLEVMSKLGPECMDAQAGSLVCSAPRSWSVSASPGPDLLRGLGCDHE